MNAPPPSNAVLRDWVQRIADHTRPSRIHWCDGSEREREELERSMVRDGTFIELDPQHHPASFLHRSDPTDVARTEHLTFISTEDPDDAGPTNHWMRREEAERRVWPLFAGAMRSRTMYVVPYLMGPVGSKLGQAGVQITDSPYVVLNLRMMTRVGAVARSALDREVVRGVHSLGDLSPDRRYIVHFPDTLEIWSVGSGYGGNALLSKKCHALRLASVRARAQGWMAEHMLVVGLTSPEGRTHYVAAAFPSACGKTHLAMLGPTLPGWKVDTVSDDVCWMHVGDDGRLWAINPENGVFGVAPGTNPTSNPNAMKALARDAIFTNVALRRGGRVWWEGMEPLDDGEVLEDWRGARWTATSGLPAAHPNARFTVALRQCSSATGTFDDPRGVPISAILFGGRRAKLTPLVYEARDWRHGVYVGATLVSETTAASTNAVGLPRHDPMAMLPFCGYNMADYFGHWLAMGEKLARPPKIFHVNWFRTDAKGEYLWPGFGENIRVLAWILERVEGRAKARETPIGLVPTPDALDLSGLEISNERLEKLLAVEPAAWLEEARRSLELLGRFGARLPKAIVSEHWAFVQRLHAAANGAPRASRHLFP